MLTALLLLSAVVLSEALYGSQLPAFCSHVHITSTDVKFEQYAANSTKLLFQTVASWRFNMHDTACFKVNLTKQDTDRANAIEAVLFAIKLDEFIQDYPIRDSHQFGIPEFQSDCKCDCPGSDSFCNARHGGKYCKGGEFCVQTFFDDIDSYGCQKQDEPSKMCCSITVRPFEGKVFTAVSTGIPMNFVKMTTQIYVLHRGKWNILKQKTALVKPNVQDSLHINGGDNISQMFVTISSKRPLFELETSLNKFYFYDSSEDRPELKEVPFGFSQPYSLGDHKFLEYRSGSWSIENALTAVGTSQHPTVTNCRQQQYTDRYDVSGVSYIMIRNSTGHLTSKYRPAPSLRDFNVQYIRNIEILPHNSVGKPESITVYHTRDSAQLVEVTVQMEQQLKIIGQLHRSVFQGFDGKFRYDRYLNRYLNITLINAHGAFKIEIYRNGELLDVQLDVATELPTPANLTAILALPSHIDQPRHVCVLPTFSNDGRVCRMILFEKEKADWFALPQQFLETEGNCPGCNVDVEEGSFLRFLNPRNWFNGIGSVSEGFALVLEIVVYLVIFIIAVAIFRKVVWPCINWALCSKSPGFSKSSSRRPIAKKPDVIEEI